MWQFIKKAWDLSVERARTKKALRYLNKQVWSIEFLTAMLIRASKVTNKSYEMDIISKDGNVIRVRTTDSSTNLKDDNIFDHLDDELKIKQFIDIIKK